MYTLYGKKGSGSASIEAALTMAAAPYRLVETASWETNDAFRELLKINPIGQIPTLALPDGGALSESAAILIHLDAAHPAAGLLPRDEAPRAQAIRGLVYIAANCYSAITVIDFPERFCSDMDDSAGIASGQAPARACTITGRFSPTCFRRGRSWPAPTSARWICTRPS